MGLTSPTSAATPATGRQRLLCLAVLEEVGGSLHSDHFEVIWLMRSIGCVFDGPFANLTVNMYVLSFLRNEALDDSKCTLSKVRLRPRVRGIESTSLISADVTYKGVPEITQTTRLTVFEETSVPRYSPAQVTKLSWT